MTYSSSYADSHAATAYANANYNAGLYADNAYSNAVSYTSTYYAAKAGATFTGNVVISNTGLIANGSIGTDKQVLLSNGSSPYWAALAPVRQNYTANGTGVNYTVSGGYTPYNLDVFVNGVKLLNGTDVDVSNGSIFTTTATYPSGTTIDVLGQIPYAGAPGSYVSKAGDTMSGTLTVGTTQIGTTFINVQSVASNLNPSSNQVFTIGNTTSYWLTVYTDNVVSQNVSVSHILSTNAIMANGSLGNPGDVLVSGGNSGNTMYWQNRSSNAVVIANTAYTATANDSWIGFTSNASTLTLPNSFNGAINGKQYRIACLGGKNNSKVNISVQSGATIYVDGITAVTGSGTGGVITFVDNVWYGTAK